MTIVKRLLLILLPLLLAAAPFSPVAQAPEDYPTAELDDGSRISDAADGAPVGTLFFTNGDHVEGQVVELAEGKLAFRPASAPQSVVVAELSKIASISFAEARTNAPTQAEQLRLRDGSVLYGKFVKLTETSLHFDALELGLVKLPRRGILQLSAAGCRFVDAQPRAEHHVVLTARGSVLVGNMDQQEGGPLLISDGEVEAKVPYPSVRAILFPRRDGGEKPPKAEGLFCEANTLAGATVIGVDPQIAAGRFSITLVGEQRVSVPIERIAEITLGGRSRTIVLQLGAGTKLKLALIRAGRFLMGSPVRETGRESIEGPQHMVTITKPFHMGVCEVTQEQYQAVMESNPSHSKGAHKPVERVSWEEAAAFCRKLSQKTGRMVRLPTEAEWEYACRAGSTTRFSFGHSDAKLGEFAWHSGNSGNETHPVGQKKPNAFGLFDMHGNVWEWCADWYGAGYYASSESTDPKGPSAGGERVHRGGSATFPSLVSRSAKRGWGPPTSRYNYCGFRVVVEP